MRFLNKCKRFITRARIKVTVKSNNENDVYCHNDKNALDGFKNRLENQLDVN